MSEFGRRAGDWDLQAIVKGPKTTSNATSNMPTSCAWFGSLGLELEGYKFGQENAAIINQVDELCNPFHHEIQTGHSPPKNVENDGVMRVGDCAKSLTSEELEQKNAMSVPNVHARATSSRRRRNKHKVTLVRHAAGEPPLSDKWNWRKYGEKAIKGSPYPRSYYRCSSSGGCLARKQVEQSNSDPGIFLITYINEHNHPYPTRRHTQAGLSLRRSSTASPKLLTTSDSTDMSASTSTQDTPIRGDQVPAQQGNKDDASVEVIGEVGRIADMAWEDDFFAGLEYLERLEMDQIEFGLFPSN